MDGRRFSTRQNAGMNGRMDSDYIWPDNFGTRARTQSETDVRTQNVRRNIIGREEIDIANTFCPPSQLEPVSQKEISMDRIDVISNGSRHTNRSCEIQRKRLALETEKARQEIEMKQKELANKMALLELERDVREAELREIEENGSMRSTSDKVESRNLYPNVRIVNPCENPLSSPVSEWVSQTQKHLPNNNIDDIYETNSNFPEEKPDENRKLSDIQLLCKSLGDTIRAVSSNSNRDSFMARQTVEKDFPIFSGDSSEWPIFISQFRRISSMCGYTQEEKMVKLQKCLRGEAKFAVSGMLLSPTNIELALKTLEMRFGRSDQIIESLIFKVRAMPQFREGNMEHLITFSTHIQSLVATIKSLDCRGHLENPQILKDSVFKLPDNLKLQWGETVENKEGKVNLEDFADWISKKARAACFVSTNIKSKTFFVQNRKDSKNHRFSPETSLLTTDVATRTECFYCRSKDHKTHMCPKLKNDDVDTRWNTVTKNKLCFTCLKPNHQTFKCKLKKICGIQGCQRPHHKILHKESFETVLEPSQINENQNNMESVLATRNSNKNILLRMVRVKLYNDNKILECVALFDEASTVTLVDQSIVDIFGIKGICKPLCIQWTNDLVSRSETSIQFDIKISGIGADSKIFTMNKVKSVRNLALPIQHISPEDWMQHIHLKGLPLYEIHERPLILIGQDNIRLTVPRKICEGPENLPMATKTCLGWVLHGKVEKTGIQRDYLFHICEQDHFDNNLHRLVKETFTLESFGVSVNQIKPNYMENRAIELMEKTVRRVDDRYEIGLLWKTEDIILPESKMNALRRLECVEKKMAKDEQFGQQYCRKIQEYLDKGYARKLSNEELFQEDNRCWYLPHFAVSNPNKPNKIRIVFDAAAKSHGVSLNDNLIPGPDLLASLTTILLNFRMRKIAFCSDVKEMFHQVKIRPEDRCAQRFLWRDGKQNKKIEIYEMGVMIFGANCSPTCAQFVKNMNARLSTDSKSILDAITKKHYVDDYLDCKDTEEEAISTILQVSRVQKMGGFELVNWISNSKEVMEKLNKNSDIMKNLNFDSQSSLQRILGLWWDAKEDTFQFKLRLPVDENKVPTKRNILKTVMSVFDPLGLIVNFTIRGRILMQDIWKSGIDWDEHVNEEIVETWKSWLYDLRHTLVKIRFPRCYSLLIPWAEKKELHIFCDASKKAFASVAYLRIISHENVNVSLIMAKARVAPTKTITIPKLELLAAVTGSRLANYILNDMELEFDKIYYWTDSTTVLQWIKGDGSRLGQFESHRVGEIQEKTNSSDWYWIPSKFNVADEATRTYMNLQEHVEFERWINGPEFLMNFDEKTWPTKQIKTRGAIDTNTEHEIVALTVSIDSNNIDFERFSKYLRISRTMAWVIRFRNILLSKLKHDNYEFPQMLNVSEIEKGEIELIRQSQYESFAEEIKALLNGKELNGRSRLKQLSPMLNDDGLMVLDGRTNFSSELKFSTRQPYILHPKHRLTRLILHHYHEKYGHQGIELILNEVRQKFWIIDARTAIKSTFARCQICKKRRAAPKIPIMGQLPPERITPNVRPFTFTGIDYFGPMSVNVGRRQEKRWGVIFTCLTIRAIHLEVAHSLTTDSAIMAIRRMLSRRGVPKQIISDNGTNFHGASEELKKAIQELDNEKLCETMVSKGIDWKFIPPGASHMGGAWERLIRSVKATFKIVLNGQSIRDEILLTLFAEVENIINTRPLTHVSVDPVDLEALTPNHFLLGSSNGNGPPGVFDEKYLRKDWKKSQRLTDAYWKRWTKEYLPTLTCRRRWIKQQPDLKIDDVVIIVDESTPRNSWKLGRVIGVFPGPDGRVRVADVKTQKGTYRRPVAKLCPFQTTNTSETTSCGAMPKTTNTPDNPLQMMNTEGSKKFHQGGECSDD